MRGKRASHEDLGFAPPKKAVNHPGRWHCASHRGRGSDHLLRRAHPPLPLVLGVLGVGASRPNDPGSSSTSFPAGGTARSGVSRHRTSEGG